MVDRNSSPKVLLTDGEGPLVFKDLARDASRLIGPEGQLIFDTISIHVAHESESGRYQPGETLAFLVPHLLTHNVTDEDLTRESANTIIANGAEEYIRSLKEEGWNVRVISTAFRHLWDTIGPKIGIPPEDIASTELDLELLREERWSNSLAETVLNSERLLLTHVQEISLALQDVRKGISLEEVYSSHPVLTETQEIMNELYEKELPNLGFYPLQETTIIGGDRKVDAAIRFSRELGISLSTVAFVGDSITDDRAHRFIRERGGLSIAVNANEFGIRNAVIAIATENMKNLKPLLDAWHSGRHEGVEGFVLESSRGSFGTERLRYQEPDFVSHVVTGENIQQIAEIHSRYRSKILGLSAPPA